MKKTIMLVCAAGMSTSLMVARMQKAAEVKVMEADIFAISASEVDSYLQAKKIDVVLLGPQVRFLKDQFEKKVTPLGIALDVMKMTDYGMMNGEKVLEHAVSLMNN